MIVQVLTFELLGTPPNWEQATVKRASGRRTRMHWAETAKGKHQWFEKTVIWGHNERQVKGWPKATPSTRARVTVRCYRVRLMDDGGASASIKPILDALQVSIRGKSVLIGGKRVALTVAGASLIWTDDPEHCILTPPGPEQRRVAHFKEERTVIEVQRL